MAFSAAQKSQIRDVLGYPDVTVYPAANLEGAMVAISATAQTRVEGYLAQITTIDAGAPSFAADSRFSKVEDVEFREGGYANYEAIRRRIGDRIAAILGVHNHASGGSSGGFTRQ